MGSPEIVERGEEEGEAVPAVAEKMGSKVIDEGGEEEPSIKVEDSKAICTKLVEEEEAIPAHAQQVESKEIKVDDDDGPPPGWKNIIRSPQKPLPSEPPPTESMGSKDFEEEEGKVETFGDQERKCSKEIEGEEVNPAHSEAIEKNEIKLERGGGGGEGEEVIPVLAEAMEIKEEGEDDDDDGPPPGWHPIVPPPSKLSTSLPPTGRTGSKEIEKEREVKVDISGDQVRISKEIKGEETVPAHTEGVENEEVKEGEDDDDDGPPPGWQHIAHVSPGPSPSLQPTEVAQMVCGSCRQLLSYPRGARHVQCSSCQTVNLVLEEHQVGQVKCGSCSILLMYPYGAPSVRCSCCRFVTQIGDHNKRPPWSTQQGRPIPTPHPVL